MDQFAQTYKILSYSYQNHFLSFANQVMPDLLLCLDFKSFMFPLIEQLWLYFSVKLLLRVLKNQVSKNLRWSVLCKFIQIVYNAYTQSVKLKICQSCPTVQGLSRSLYFYLN